ncbi:single-stranded-DNA-specific exonuclease RecJ [Patescibacteria group bacterium]|nr:single-stranded-DNA-specific exonuclease RecJ [Patescibacteria group bacterium]MBU1016003.1 single-stranded-DNA-specific exonuclease RecJ [Patescibacteria group bacterium]MBU1684628.1 single-stranded-DNA-specific exonuclease RecJ [Patescibacteria group bacterium]MBU1939068.1 single-stranded-DNA-specific exonuclease RecJ [Patescibacteria group bacterium]
MSFLGKKWVIQNEKKELSLIDKMLENRGLKTDEEVYSFFNYSLKKLHDPFLLKDMQNAVERIKTAIEKQENIMIFGDYDVDGISATALVYDLLQKVGANVHYTLPDREKDGYGMKDYFIRRFSDEGVNLVITVDCGTANVEEVKLANELGIDVIVTDHHDVPEVLPEPYALINAKQQDCDYPNKELSGSAVAFKLVSALAPFYFDEETAEKYLYAQMGIAVLGLIADCMKLTGENRVLTNNGLKSLSEGNHPGIRAMLEEAGIDTGKVTSATVGFVLGPRINAAGRLDSAEHALEVLLGNTEKVETLSRLNSKRQMLVQKFVKEAIIQVGESGIGNHIIVVSSPEWNAGTLGLIAGKMCDLFHRPCIAMQEKENEYVASCRSLNGFDITAFLRKEAGELFTSCGGHMLAGGFTMPRENKDKLIDVIGKKAVNYIDPENFHSILELECEVSLSDLSFAISENIRKFEPFGNGNAEPTLVLKNAQILTIKQVGKSGEHLQFPVQVGNQRFQAIAFRFGEHLDKIKPENNYDIAFNLEVNEWQGYKKLQLRVVDLKESS